MIVSGYLSDCVKITKVQDHTATGTSAVNSSSVDMLGYDAVLFITSFGTAAAGNTVEVSQSSDDSTFVDLAGTNTSSGTSDEDVYVDVVRPTKRYVRAEVARGTSSTLESIYAIQYKARSLPITNSVSGTIVGEQHSDKAEGTA